MSNEAARPTPADTFMAHARVVAKRSTCVKTYGGIGAVIVVEGRIVATGYAGSMRGDDHCTDVGCLLDDKTGKCIRTVHAELNAVLNAAFHGVRIEGGRLYCTVSPCFDCFKALRNAGITAVFYAEEYRHGVQRQQDYAKKFAIVFAQMEG